MFLLCYLDKFTDYLRLNYIMKLMINHINIIYKRIIVLFFLGISTYGLPITYAQNTQAIDIYKKAIDDVNCLAIKNLLIGYDRPIAANNIKDCTYLNIRKEIKKVKENQIKGYKVLFLNLAEEINNYKRRIENPEEYSIYANRLEELSSLTTRQFKSVCEKHKTPDNTICVNLSKKVLTLEGQINDIVNKALEQIAARTFRDGKPPEIYTPPKRASESPEQEASVGQEASSAQTSSSPPAYRNEPQQPQQSTVASNSISWLTWLVILILIVSLIWLARKQAKLKEKIEDLEMLSNVRSQRKR